MCYNCQWRIYTFRCYYHFLNSCIAGQMCLPSKHSYILLRRPCELLSWLRRGHSKIFQYNHKNRLVRKAGHLFLILMLMGMTCVFTANLLWCVQVSIFICIVKGILIYLGITLCCGYPINCSLVPYIYFHL